jgi:hypothetical protein
VTGHAEAEPAVQVYLTNATRTSRGPGPGPKRLPAAEAGRLVENRLAVYGSEPPGDDVKTEGLRR